MLSDLDIYQLNWSLTGERVDDYLCCLELTLKPIFIGVVYN